MIFFNIEIANDDNIYNNIMIYIIFTIYTTVSQARRWDRSQGQDGSERPSGSPYIPFGMNRT